MVLARLTAVGVMVLGLGAALRSVRAFSPSPDDAAAAAPSTAPAIDAATPGIAGSSDLLRVPAAGLSPAPSQVPAIPASPSAPAPVAPPATAPAAAAAVPTRQFWFGVAVENINPYMARQLKLHPDQGLLLIMVLPGSPAAMAGLRAGDLLIEINGKPLTVSDQLARAASALDPTPPAASAASATPAAPAMLTSTFVFLREGDRHQVELTPVPRPEQMLAVGRGLGAIQPPAASAPADPSAANVPVMRNYVAPNGAALMVGPGYQFDWQGQSSAVNVIRRAVENGQAIVLSQETDPAGHIRNTITQGGKTYIIDPAHLDQIPENIRGLAQQMLGEAAAASAKSAAVSTTIPAAQDVAGRLQDQDSRIRQLELEVRRLEEQQATPDHPAPTAAPGK